MRRDIRALTIALTASCLLAGCGWMHRQAHKNDDVYKTSVQEHPLEVPPDLDKPNLSGALTIPDAAPTGSAPAASATAPSTAPAGEAVAAAAPAGTTAPLAGEAVPPAILSNGTLHVQDSVDSVWNRVGLAIERSGAATILSRDEAGRSYEVQTVGQVVSKPGWFKKAITLGMAKGTTTAQVHLKLRVTAEGNGSMVTADGATDDASKAAAQALLDTLKQRLS